MTGNTPIGILLIEKGADLDKRDMFGDTALSLAAQTGHPSFVELLLRSGASLDCHPHGNSLDIFLDWVGQYTSGKAQIANIKELFARERKLRAQVSLD
jgi:ankyrin repeat protein